MEEDDKPIRDHRLGVIEVLGSAITCHSKVMKGFDRSDASCHQCQGVTEGVVTVWLAL